MIHLYRVSKYYEGIPALREITFSVDKGEFVFVTGPSGAGKTTLLKILFCAEHADEGQIIIQGMNTFRLNSSSIPYLRRNMGFVFQDYKLLAHKTVFENIALALKVIGAPHGDIERRALLSLKKVGREKKDHLTPLKLSGGEQQRVAIARALVNEPQILLADEPTGNLDSKTSIEVMGVFQKLNDEGITIVMVTHELDIAHYCRRNLIVRDGRVVNDTPVLNRSIAEEELAKI